MAAVLLGNDERAAQILRKTSERALALNLRILARHIYQIDDRKPDWSLKLSGALARELGWFQQPAKPCKQRQQRTLQIHQRVLSVKKELGFRTNQAACDYLVRHRDALVSKNPKMTQARKSAELLARYYEGRRLTRALS